MISFTAIDFETATYKRHSICQVGIIRFENGEIKDEYKSLIQPPENCYFKRLQDIHGITPGMTKKSPTFGKIWEKISHYIEDQTVVAHNGFSFDFQCLKQALEYYNIAVPLYKQQCTYKIYGKKLTVLCDKYGIELNHHDALSDAKACGILFAKHLGDKISTSNATSNNSLESLSKLINTGSITSELIKNPKFTPTTEQKEILQSVLVNSTVKIMALAGTGKTTTLQYITENYDKKFLYLAFNRSIVEDSKGKFGGNVTCKTIHSLAYQAMRLQSYSNDKLIGTLTSPYLVDKLKIKDRKLNKNNTLKRYHIGSILCSIIDNFCNSADALIADGHFPVKELELRPSLKRHIQYFTKVANEIWQAMLSNSNALILGHNGYLKAWQLTKPVILGYQHLLLDEAQDSNACTLDIVLRQSFPKVIVGDPYQTIYEWRGAIGSLETIQSNDTKYLTASFRFNSTIADFVNVIIDNLGSDRKIIGQGKGLSKKKSILTTEDNHLDIDAVICSSNLSVVANVFDFIFRNIRVTIMGGAKEIIEYVIDAKEIIQNNKRGESRFFLGINGKKELSEFLATSGHNTGEVTRFFQIIDMPNVIDILEKSDTYANDYTVIISTVWKIKGREWDTVLLDEQLTSAILMLQQHSDINKKENTEAKRVLYVAATRAKKQLLLSTVIKKNL